ncbi:hypothetical protein ACSBR1_036538 [Camellia fascicularis]
MEKGNGGWISIVRQQKGCGAKGHEANHGLFTVFLDNLPTTMDVQSLFKLFTKFDILKDVFIPLNKKRIVTNSRFGGNRDEQSRRRPQSTRRFLETNSIRGKVPYTNQRSFTEVLKGETTTVAGNVSTTIKVDEVGHGWLYESAILRLNVEYSTHDIGKALKENGLD